MNDLANPIFTDETKAREWLEAQVWPDGPVCPHCGVTDQWTRLEGKAHRAGLFQCNACRQQFTVTVGTVFERSKIPLTKWLMAVYLLSASKKGMSTNQLSRMLGLPYKTAWFMTHRIREAMDQGKLPGGLGGEGQHVEADETFIGTKRPRRTRIDPKTGKEKIERGTGHKHVVMALVERGGRSRAIHVQRLDRETVYSVLFTNIDRSSRLQTDDATHYRLMKRHFKGGHGHVRHKLGQYVKGADYTNTVEAISRSSSAG